MKKIVSILLAVTLIIISVTACSNKSTSTESTTKEPTSKEPITKEPTTKEPITEAPITEASITEEPISLEPIIDKQLIDVTNSDVKLALNSYKSVLQNRSDFFNTGHNKRMNISELLDISSSINLKLSKFAIIDLDNDNVPEVVLGMSVDDNDLYYEILRYQSGIVYGYSLPLRGFNQLKIDGTFGFSGGASNHGFGTITFAENTYSIDKITYVESHWDSSKTTSYFVDHQSATEEEFHKATDYELSKPNVTWYEFSEDNIEKHFLPQEH